MITPAEGREPQLSESRARGPATGVLAGQSLARSCTLLPAPVPSLLLGAHLSCPLSPLPTRPLGALCRPVGMVCNSCKATMWVCLKWDQNLLVFLNQDSWAWDLKCWNQEGADTVELAARCAPWGWGGGG